MHAAFAYAAFVLTWAIAVSAVPPLGAARTTPIIRWQLDVRALGYDGGLWCDRLEARAELVDRTTGIAYASVSIDQPLEGRAALGVLYELEFAPPQPGHWRLVIDCVHEWRVPREQRLEVRTLWAKFKRSGRADANRNRVVITRMRNEVHAARCDSQAMGRGNAAGDDEFCAVLSAFKVDDEKFTREVVAAVEKLVASIDRELATGSIWQSARAVTIARSVVHYVRAVGNAPGQGSGRFRDITPCDDEVLRAHIREHFVSALDMVGIEDVRFREEDEGGKEYGDDNRDDDGDDDGDDFRLFPDGVSYSKDYVELCRASTGQDQDGSAHVRSFLDCDYPMHFSCRDRMMREKVIMFGERPSQSMLVSDDVNGDPVSSGKDALVQRYANADVRHANTIVVDIATDVATSTRARFHRRPALLCALALRFASEHRMVKECAESHVIDMIDETGNVVVAAASPRVTQLSRAAPRGRLAAMYRVVDTIRLVASIAGLVLICVAITTLTYFTLEIIALLVLAPFDGY